MTVQFLIKLKTVHVKLIIILLFTVLLILASQRIEGVLAEWLQTEWLKNYFADDVTTKRGSMPSLVEWAILAWVAGKSICHSVKFHRYLTIDGETNVLTCKICHILCMKFM